MTKIELELHDDIISVFNKLKNIQDTGIELVVPEGAVLFENILNLKLLKNWSDRESKVLNFNTNDVNGQNMLMFLENGGEESMADGEEDEGTEALEEYVSKKKLAMPKINLPAFRLKSKLPLIIFIILLLLVGGAFAAYKIISGLQSAEVKIVVNSQPLTRSLEIKVRDGAESSAADKILAGTTVEASVEDELTIETTGEKTVGEFAEGEITIYNKTSEEKEFKEGTDIIFNEGEDDELIYELKDDVTVPAAVPGENPGDPITPSGESVEVIATEIGEDYNLDEGEDLKVEDQEESDFEAEVTEEIDGGAEEEVSIVAQEDLDELKAQLAENSEEKVMRALDEAIPSDEKLVKGSTGITVTKEEYSHALEEETEEVALKETFVARGLVYRSEELDNLLEELVEEFVPEGYVLSTKERVINVEVLGNTDSTVLTNTEADLQVTLKTFVVPDISEDAVKEELIGKSLNEAQKILGSVRNIKTYELNMERNIPFFDKIPDDKDRIKITVERE